MTKNLWETDKKKGNQKFALKMTKENKEFSEKDDKKLTTCNK